MPDVQRFLKHFAILLEGGDGVGKHTVFTNLILEMLHRGHNVATMDYPQYWFFGNYIKQMNRGALQVYFDRHSVPFDEVLELRCALFALDRLLGIAILIPLLEKYEGNISVISDRGWMSNVVTNSYVHFKSRPSVPPSQADADGLLGIMQRLDQDFISTFNDINILLHTENSHTNGTNERIHGDDLEAMPVQVITEMYYLLVVNSQYRVTTRENDQWVDLSKITNEVLDISSLPPSLTGNRNPCLEVVGPRQMCRLIGVESQLTPEELELIDQWELYSLSPESYLPKYEPDGKPIVRKDKLNQLELALSQILASKVATNPTQAAAHFPDIVKEGIRRLITDYPAILDLINTIDQIPENAGNNMRDFIAALSQPKIAEI